MSEFLMYTCPVCKDWSLEGSELIPREEQNQIAREHLLECYGLPVEMAS